MFSKVFFRGVKSRYFLLITNNFVSYCGFSFVVQTVQKKKKTATGKKKDNINTEKVRPICNVGTLANFPRVKKWKICFLVHNDLLSKMCDTISKLDLCVVRQITISLLFGRLPLH